MSKAEQTKQQGSIGEVSTSFMAIAPYVEKTIVSARESQQSGSDWVRWGDRNAYPDYLQGLSEDCTTLNSILLGLVDYIVGNGVQVAGRDAVNGKGMSARSLVKDSAKDAGKFGGFAWQLIPDKGGRLAEVYPLQMRWLRMNREADVFYYSEEWRKGSGAKILIFPKYNPVAGFAKDKDGKYSSAVLFVKLWGDNTYPSPLYASAIKMCEVERGIDEFHLGNLARGFMGSYLINFYNGVPTDQIKAQIERDVQQKLGGVSNAGRILLNFAQDKEHGAVLQKMEVADYGEKYATLTKHCRQQIFTAFRAAPVLFGIPTENNGFAVDDYENSFKLFNRTIVAPIQDAIVEAWGTLGLGEMTIEPFTLDGADKAATSEPQGTLPETDNQE